MKFENTEIWGFKHAIRGMRNPMNSWDKSDSEFGYFDCGNCDHNHLCNECMNVDSENIAIESPIIGTNDLKLMKNLIKAGSDERKFMRQIMVSVDITAPLFWYKEFDTYKIGTVANSTSTMHKIISKEFTQNMFELEGIRGFKNQVKQYVPTYYDEELWCDYPDNDLYSISSHGQVKRKAYQPINNHYLEEIILKPQINENGYLYVKIFIDNKSDERQNRLINQLVAKTFLANENKYNHVNHKDGNKMNNHISNLEWISDEENQRHAVINNLRKSNTNTYNGKLTKEQRNKIIERNLQGESSRKIAPDYGVSHSTILSIINNEYDYGENYSDDYEFFMLIINRLNELRNEYLKTNNKEIWYSIIKILPESWLQKRTITMNYEVLRNMYFARRNHKLTEWHTFCNWVESLPYAKELIMYEGGDK